MESINKSRGHSSDRLQAACFGIQLEHAFQDCALIICGVVLIGGSKFPPQANFPIWLQWIAPYL